MAEQPEIEAAADSAAPARPTPLGIYDKPKPQTVTGIEIIAIALSVLWLLGAVVFFVVLPQDPQGAGGGNVDAKERHANRHACRHERNDRSKEERDRPVPFDQHAAASAVRSQHGQENCGF